MPKLATKGCKGIMHLSKHFRYFKHQPKLCHNYKHVVELQFSHALPDRVTRARAKAMAAGTNLRTAAQMMLLTAKGTSRSSAAYGITQREPPEYQKL